MALPNDLSRMADGLAKLEASNPDYSGGKTIAARALVRDTLVLHKIAVDAMASTTTAVTAAPGTYMPRAGRLVAARYVPITALTAGDTNYATLLVQKHDGAGGTGTTMATIATTTTDSGNLVAGTVESLTLSATVADTRFAAGEVVGFAITKAASGLALPAGTITLYVEWESADAFGVA